MTRRRRSIERIRALACAATLIGLSLAAAEPDLQVTATYPDQPTGTMHYATSLTLSAGRAAPLVIERELTPIPGPHFRLAHSRFLLLGWSSTGAGMQTIHVLLVRVHDNAVRLDDELAINSDRPSAGVLLRFPSAGSVRIGIPEPPRDFAHDPDEWFLNGGGESLDLSRMRALAFRRIRRGKNDVFYDGARPAGRAPRRVAWIDVTSRGFRFAR